MALPYWHVDAFADRPFAGNPAAVILLERPLPDATLQAIAAENAFPATAFVGARPPGKPDHSVRWFSPHGEIRLCGHATLASGHVLLTRDGGERVTFQTARAGILEVRSAAGAYELALPAIPTAPGEWPEAAARLGAPDGILPLETWRCAERYSLFVFASEAQVRGLSPDLRGLAMLGDDQFICTAPGTTADVVSRVFVPGAGIDEDSVTGSAHAVLAPFWAARLGRERFTAHQASPRGGSLTCRIDGRRVWLGGRCVTMVEGTFYLPG